MTDPTSTQNNYTNYFGNIYNNDRRGRTYDTLYPLDTHDLNTKLRFAPWNVNADYQTQTITVDNQPLPVPPGTPPPYPPKGTEPQIIFSNRSPADPTNPISYNTIISPAQLSIYAEDNNNPTGKINNFLSMRGNGDTFLTDNNFGSPLASNVAVGNDPFNLRFIGVKFSNNKLQNYDNIMCHNKLYGQISLENANDPNFYDKPSCKWKTNEEVFACCTAQPGQTDLDRYCSPAFMPDNAPGSLCSEFMLNICENNWESDVCKRYLQSFVNNRDVDIVVQNTVKNYINGMSDRTGCGTNQYTTPNSPNRCKPSGSSDYRDDSKDDFLVNVLPMLCTANDLASTYGNGICDQILNQYCAQFTREDLLNLDSNGTLQKICGCHLSSSTSVIPSNPPDAGLNLGPFLPFPQPNQYPYPGISAACDPICSYSKTIPAAGLGCASTVCILDKISINEINSKSGDITIKQVCKNAGNEGRSTCYISGLDINSINSETGGVKIDQDCESCYAFCPTEKWSLNAPAGAVKVDCGDISNFDCGSCKTGRCEAPPSKGGNGGNGSGNGGKSSGNNEGFFTRHPYAFLYIGLGLVALLIIVIALLIIYV